MDGPPSTRRFVLHFLGRYPRQTALIVVLLLVSGLAEGVGIVALLPLLEFAQGGGAADPSALRSAFLGAVSALGLRPSVGMLLALIVVLIGAKALLLWLAMRQVGHTVARVAADLRLALLRALLEARWEHFVSRPVGYFANAVSAESHQASWAYLAVCHALASATQAAVYLAVLLAFSWRLGVAALVVGAAAALLLGRFVRTTREAGRSQARVMNSLVAGLTEALAGIKSVKAMAREAEVRPLLERDARQVRQAQQRAVTATESLRGIYEPLLVALIAGGLYVALVQRGMGLPEVLVLAVVFYRLLGSLGELQSRYQAIVVHEAAYWNLVRHLREAEGAREPPGEGRPPPPLREGITLEHVSFAHGGHEVLRDVSLTIPAGAFVAFTGPSGSGKTTLADVAVGLLRPDRGVVSVDGVPLASLDTVAWRRTVGYVPQEVLLFNDSIYRNVALGDPRVDRAEVRRALEAAGAAGFVDALPEGMEHVIGERGGRLSGGQRQRISIARALVGRPALLVLDEATAALDAESEAEICRTLRGLRGEVTIVAISHRPALRDAADLVFEVEGGAVRAAAGARPLLATGAS